MKNYLFIVIAILGMVFTSCKKEEDTVPPQTEDHRDKHIVYEANLKAMPGTNTWFLNSMVITYKLADGTLKDTVVDNPNSGDEYLQISFDVPWNFKGYIKIKAKYYPKKTKIMISKYYPNDDPYTYKMIEGNKYEYFIDETIYQPELTKDITQ